MSEPMRRDFTSRDELIAYLRNEMGEETPAQSVAETAVFDNIPTIRGGRQAAEIALDNINASAYEATRNYLDGAVTHLSPYIRHGVLSLAEVRDKAQADSRINKLVQELGWRDFFQRVHRKVGRAIWQDLEPYKTGFSADDYADALPKDIENGTTGLDCIDAFSRKLRETGYLHNHARMWLAGYVVHWRKVKWQTGARWFLQHLLDGDPASNNLSWQWVASTYSHKPYFFNRENIEK